MVHIANYKEHRNAFQALLKPDCRKPILLYRGKSGSGKSTLMEYCRNEIGDDFHKLAIDLRTTSNVMQVFLQAGRRLNWEHFHHFKEHLSELNPKFNIHVNGNTQAGVGNMINVELKTLFDNASLEQGSEHYSALTNVWIEDINNLDKPCVMLLDVYEKSRNDIKSWIDCDLLGCAANSDKMRVVIAGQTIPDSFEWNDCCEIKELDGVYEAEAWQPVIKEMGYRIPSESPLEFLRGICLALKGNPSEIIKFIEKFPRTQ